MVKHTRRVRGGGNGNDSFTIPNPMHKQKTCENIVEDQIKLYNIHLDTVNDYTTTRIYEPLKDLFLNEIKRSGNKYDTNNISNAETKQEIKAEKNALDIQKKIIEEIKSQLKNTRFLGLFGGKKNSFIDHCEKGTYEYTKQNDGNFTIYYKYDNSMPTLEADKRYIRLFNNNEIVHIEKVFDAYINIRKPTHKYRNERPTIFGGKRKQTQHRNKHTQKRRKN